MPDVVIHQYFLASSLHLGCKEFSSENEGFFVNSNLIHLRCKISKSVFKQSSILFDMKHELAGVELFPSYNSTIGGFSDEIIRKKLNENSSEDGMEKCIPDGIIRAKPNQMISDWLKQSGPVKSTSRFSR